MPASGSGRVGREVGGGGEGRKGMGKEEARTRVLVGVNGSMAMWCIVRYIESVMAYGSIELCKGTN